jgi:polar amino acid transport system substrate-binding protein
MKKLALLILIAVLVVTIAAGCTKQQTNLTTLEKIKSTGVLTMGLDDSFPPMEYRDEKNNLVGFDIDLGNALAGKLGVKAEFVTTDFSGIIEALKVGKFNMILSCLSITDERKESILFSEPYIMEGQIVAIKKSDANIIVSTADLKGKIVASQLGSTSEQAAKKLEGLKELKSYDKVTEAFHDLSIGRIDAVVVDELVGMYYISTSADNYAVLSEKLTDEPVGIGFKKEDTELQAAIQKAFDELKADGTLTEISKKWFGVDIYNK